MLRLFGVIGLTMLVLLATMLPAEAHRPLSIGGEPAALSLEDPEVSQVIYADLGQDKVELVHFHGEKGQRIVLQLGVPQIPRLKGFRPRLALIGPGLLPFEDPEGGLCYSFEPESLFFEPFTRTSSWVAPRFETSLREAGEYWIAVFAPEAGKYWLAIGEKEVFGPLDWLSLPATIWRVRRFHEVPLWPDLAVLAGTVGVVGLLIGRRSP